MQQMIIDISVGDSHCLALTRNCAVSEIFYSIKTTLEYELIDRKNIKDFCVNIYIYSLYVYCSFMHLKRLTKTISYNFYFIFVFIRHIDIFPF